MKRPTLILAALALFSAAPNAALAGGYSSSNRCPHGYSKSHCYKPPSNKPPYAKDDCTIKVTVNQSITINVLANDSDPERDKLTIIGVSRPYHGSAKVQYNKIVYTPAKNYSGSDLFYYTISDGKGHSDVAKVCIEVCKPTPPPNRPPYAKDDCTITVVANESKTIDVLANDTDPDGDKLTVYWVSQPFHGTATIQSNKVVYKPARNYDGSDLIYYAISDGKGHCSIAKICIKVVKSTPPPNNPPKAKDDCDDNEVSSGDEITIDVLANDSDADGDDLTVISVTNPAHGTAAINGDGTITYKANAGYVGDDFFAYTISDGKGGKDTAKVCLLVKALPPPPTDCDGILLFGADGYMTTELAKYLVQRGIPQAQVTIYRTSTASYKPNALADAINYFKSVHNGQLPCTMLFDVEYVGPNGMFTGLDANDQALLKNLMLGGMGLVYAEPVNLAPTGYGPNTPLGQIPNVLPVIPHTWSDHDLVYDIVDPNSPLVNPTLPGLFTNPYGTGNLSFWPQSSAQDQGIAIDLGNPVPGVQYANVNVVLRSSSTLPVGYLGTGLPTAYTLNYQPAGGPTAAQPGARVAILGTDPFPKGFDPGANEVSPSILALYYNALVYTGS